MITLHPEPRRLPLLFVMLVLSIAFVLLGRWQLQRAAFNRAQSERFETAATLPEIRGSVSVDELPSLRFRQMRLQGRYADVPQILLDNMTHAGQVGYQVLTPFRTRAGTLVLVNRGFVAAGASRSELPDVRIGQTPRELTGRVDILPRAGLDLDTPLPDDRSAPLVVLSYPDLADIEAVLGEPVEPFQLLLDPAADDGFLRDWGPPPNLHDRNIAYAVQWFGLALAALVIGLGAVLRPSMRGGER